MEIDVWLRFLARYFVVTVELSVAATVFSILLASVLTLMRVGQVRVLRVLAQIETDVFRSIPLLALLFVFYYVLAPHLQFIGQSTFWVGVMALTLSESSYLAEVYRAAVERIPAQQWDAAESIGLSWWQTVRLVITPQAIPAGIPGTVNIIVGVIKDSSLTSLIAVSELTLGATILVSETFLPFQVYLLLAAIYFAMVVPLAYLARYSEVVMARRIGLRAASRVLAKT